MVEKMKNVRLTINEMYGLNEKIINQITDWFRSTYEPDIDIPLGAKLRFTGISDFISRRTNSYLSYKNYECVGGIFCISAIFYNSKDDRLYFVADDCNSVICRDYKTEHLISVFNHLVNFFEQHLRPEVWKK